VIVTKRCRSERRELVYLRAVDEWCKGTWKVVRRRWQFRRRPPKFAAASSISRGLKRLALARRKHERFGKQRDGLTIWRTTRTLFDRSDGLDADPSPLG